MTTTATPSAGPKSHVMHSVARWYDALTWTITLGRERALRERLVDLAAVAPGETVLDVGCGTGTLTLAAWRRAGTGGSVHGVDASPEMIVRAQRKAARAGAGIVFEVARAEALPCPDASVDVVLSSLMLHHLPAAVRERFGAEIRRVLRPGGRVLAVDFEPPAHGGGGLISRLHRRMHVPQWQILALLERSGLRIDRYGSVGASDLQYAIARAPRPDDGSSSVTPAQLDLPPLPLPVPLRPLARLGRGLHAMLLHLHGRR